MTGITTQRYAMALPLVGATFLMISIFVPVQLAAITWVLGMVWFILALTCATIVQRRRKTEPAAVRQGGLT